jgi:hypothetical protein
VRAVANDAPGPPVIEDRQTERSNHEDDSADCRQLAQKSTGSTRAKRSLATSTAKGACKIRPFARLQKHYGYQNNGNENVHCQEKVKHKKFLPYEISKLE